MWLGYDEPSDLLHYEGWIVKLFYLILILTGNPATVAAIPFEDMASCQDAKTVMMADAGGLHVVRAYCFPSAR